MDHEPVLISTIAIGLTAAFVGGLLARRLGLPSILGYILAGVVIGPFTPGLIADSSVATELAEIGVILLMFGVGIHFSLDDLMAVRALAVPGAIIRIAIATLLGVAFAVAIGWGVGAGLVLGLAISMASTVVLLRALEERNELDTVQGRTAVGWVIVEDLVTVAVLVVLPTVAPLLGGTDAGTASVTGNALGDLVVALGKAAVFAAVMIVAGKRLIPPLLIIVARENSRELFSLAVLAIALGIAFAASSIFGISLALGAFLAGAIVSESDMSHQAAADALPLRDAFAVLFFVSVGMLLDPTFLIEHPLEVLAVVGLIVVAKSLVAIGIVAAFGYPLRTGLTVAAGLAQIGEFSFILGTVGLSLALLPPDGFQLIVAGALASIAVNPFLFRLIEPLDAYIRSRERLHAVFERRSGDVARLPQAAASEPLRRHAILAGYGRVGRTIAAVFERRGYHYVVISLDRRHIEELRARGVPAIYGDASRPELLEHAGVQLARMFIVAIGDGHATRLAVERARAANPTIDLIVRTHSDGEAARLRGIGGSVQAIHAERELAVQMARYSLRRFGVSGPEAEAIAQSLRGRGAIAPAPPRPPSRLQMLRARLSRQGRPPAPEGVEPAVPPAGPPAAIRDVASQDIGVPGEIDRVP
jgi:CPA2 family monovalent cation:H+ antiporter-2